MNDEEESDDDDDNEVNEQEGAAVEDEIQIPFIPPRIPHLNFQGVELLVQLSYAQALPRFYTVISTIHQQQQHILLQRRQRNNHEEDVEHDEQEDLLVFDITQSVTNQLQRPVRLPRHHANYDGLDYENNQQQQQQRLVREGEVEEHPQQEQEEMGGMLQRIDHSDHNTFRIYDRAFVFAGVPEDITEEEGGDVEEEGEEGDHPPVRRSRVRRQRSRPVPLTESTLARVAAMTMFNCGLVHHLRGLSQTETRQQDFDKSGQFYSIGTRLLQVHPNDSIRCRLVTLALHNNLAHLYQHCFDLRAFATCLNQLGQTLNTGQPSDDDFHFAMNLLVSQNLEDRVAPSA